MRDNDRTNDKIIDDILNQISGGKNSKEQTNRRDVAEGSEDIRNKIDGLLRHGKSVVEELRNDGVKTGGKAGALVGGEVTPEKSESDGVTQPKGGTDRGAAQPVNGDFEGNDTKSAYMADEDKKPGNRTGVNTKSAGSGDKDKRSAGVDKVAQPADENKNPANSAGNDAKSVERTSDERGRGSKAVDRTDEGTKSGNRMSGDTKSADGSDSDKKSADRADGKPDGGADEFAEKIDDLPKGIKEIPAIENTGDFYRSTERKKKLDQFFADYEQREGIVIGKKSKKRADTARKNAQKEKPLPAQSPESDRDEEQDASFGHSIIGKLMTEATDNEEPADFKRARPETIEEYTGAENRDEVINELTSLNRKGLFKTVICFSLSAAVLILNLLTAHSGVFSSLSESGVFTLSIINVLLMLAIVVTGIGSFAEGIKGLFTVKPVKESLPSLAMILSVIYGIFISFSQTAGGNALTYSVFGVAALSFSLTVFGKLLHNKAVCKNFDILSRSRDKYAIRETYRKTLPHELRGDCEKIQTVVKTKLATDFLERSYTDQSQRADGKATVVYILAIIAVGILGVFKAELLEMTAVQALLVSLSSAAAAASVFAGSVVYTLPYFVNTVRSFKSGGALIGYCADQSLKKADAYLMKDEILFRGSDCTIKGMKMLDDSDIYDAITKIASIMVKVGGPLKTCFTSVLGNKSGQLCEVEHVKTFDGKGIEAQMGEDRVFFGTTVFLKSCGIRIPDSDYEVSLRKKGKEALMFAENGRVRALFVIDYAVYDENKFAAKTLESDNMSLLIFTKDYHIDETLIKSKTGTQDLDIHILGPETAPSLEGDLGFCEKLSSPVVSVTGLLGIIAAVRAQNKLKKTFRILSVIKYFSMALALLLLAFMIFSHQPVACAQLLAYQIIWFAVSVIITYII